ncbi:hypothetical protein STBA_68140 [Streptomyces sp. MP131-18]|nr:hypothetical protein STBA_68140 [Streptomyces sp. MP131-18]
MTLAAPPVKRYPSKLSVARCMSAAYSWCPVPTNTPVRLPRRESGTIPARSNASHEVSSSSRCCGSIASASRGPMPKNPASKRATPSRKPPSRP